LLLLHFADMDGADTTTLELNQPRAIVNVTDKQQAELSGAAAAAAPAPALHDSQAFDSAAEPPAAAEAPAAAGAAAAPATHQLQLLMPGPTIRRRLRGFRSLAVMPKAGAASGAPAAAAAAAAAAASGAAEGPPFSKPPNKDGRKRESKRGQRGPCSIAGTPSL
jgi:hypothetical protein